MFTTRLLQLLVAESSKPSRVSSVPLRECEYAKELGEASLLTLGAPGGSNEGYRQTRPRFIPVPPRR